MIIIKKACLLLIALMLFLPLAMAAETTQEKMNKLFQSISEYAEEQNQAESIPSAVWIALGIVFFGLIVYFLAEHGKKHVKLEAKEKR